MFLDIVLVLLLLLCMGYGYYRGFVGAIMGFAAKFISLILAFIIASPFATLLNNWFGLSRAFDGILGGGGGHFISILICGTLIYILFRLFFHTVRKFVHRVKENNKAVDRIDKIAGIFLGATKFVCLMILLSTIVFLLSVIPLVGNSVDWLFNGSTIGQWIYDVVVRHVLPTFGDTAMAYVMGLLER